MNKDWHFFAFVKLARIGSCVFLPTADGQFLLQENTDPGPYVNKLRPPGGGKEKKDKDLHACAVRELHEEFGLDPLEIKKDLKFLGYEYRRSTPWWGSAVFELKNHGLTEGTYQASNDPDEKVKLVKADLDDPDYNGPQPHKLLSEAAKEKGDDLIKRASDPDDIKTIDDYKTGSEEDPLDAPTRNPIDWSSRLVRLRLRHGRYADGSPMPVEEAENSDAVKSARVTVDEAYWPKLNESKRRAVGDKLETGHFHWTFSCGHKNGCRCGITAKDATPVTLDIPCTECSGMLKEANITPIQAKVMQGKNLTTAMRAAPLIKTCDVEIVKPKDDFDKSAGLHTPENWDHCKELDTRDFKVIAGCNDWENRWCSIAITFGHDDRQRRVWANLVMPKEELKEWDGDWGRNVFKRWLKMADVHRAARAREFKTEGYTAWQPDDFIQAAVDVSDIKECGESRLDWEDVEKSAATAGLASGGVNETGAPAPNPVPVNFQGLPPTTGPEAIGYALQNLDLDKMEADAHDIVKRKLKSKRPLAVKRLGYIQGFKRSGITPADLMISRVPVIPPQYRPYSVAGDTFIPGDANELYRDLLNMTNMHAELKKHLGEEGVKANKLRIYDAARAVYGFGEPTSPKTKERGVNGFLQKLVGSNPKHSIVARKLLSRDMDFVGRGVIGVDPDLGLDEIGIPESAAWKPYGPYVQRRLIRAGMSREAAVKAIETQSTEARNALNAELKERPVMYSRAPAWHKFNSIGGWPKLIKGNTIMVNPLITTGVAGDFDGDRQIGKVLVLSKISLNENVKMSYLTLPVSDITVVSMIQNQVIPTFNQTTHQVSVVDLEDFPRGKLLQSKQGANGLIDLYACDGIRVLALDETVGKPVWAEVSHFSVHHDRETEIVNTVLGRQIITDNDPRAVYGIASDTKDLTYERFTPTAAEARNVAIPFVNDIDKVLATATVSEVEVTSDQACTFAKLTLTSDVGYLLGALCGDGWWDKEDGLRCHSGNQESRRRQIHIADLKGFNAAKVETTLRNIAGKESLTVHRYEMSKTEDSTRYGATARHSFSFNSSWILSAFLTQHMGGERDENTSGAANKRLPGFAFQAPQAFREGMLCGLIDTDGTCNNCVGTDGVAQFQTSFSSTSLRLVRDVQFLALTLGIHSNISFSKTTTADNSSWLLTFSALAVKRATFLSGLQSPWKREAWEKGVVDFEGPSGQRSNRVPMPEAVAKLLERKVECPKITPAMRKLGGAELSIKKAAGNVRSLIRRGQEENSISRCAVLRVIEAVKTQEQRDAAMVTVALDTLKASGQTGKIDRAGIQYIRDALAVVAPFYGDATLLTASRRIQACLNTPLRTGHMPLSTVDYASKFLITNPVPVSVLQHPLVIKWLELVNNETISWTTIKSVEKTGKRETGYDLTVPGYETFTNVDGLVLSNTMTFHVPSLASAVDDVKNKIMPSKMLWSIKDPSKVMPAPKHEAILGLDGAHVAKAKRRHAFPNEASALAAIRKGDVSLTDEIQIGNQQPTA